MSHHFLVVLNCLWYTPPSSLPPSLLPSLPPSLRPALVRPTLVRPSIQAAGIGRAAETTLPAHSGAWSHPFSEAKGGGRLRGGLAGLGGELGGGIFLGRNETHQMVDEVAARLPGNPNVPFFLFKHLRTKTPCIRPFLSNGQIFWNSFEYWV